MEADIELVDDTGMVGDIEPVDDAGECELLNDGFVFGGIWVASVAVPSVIFVQNFCHSQGDRGVLLVRETSTTAVLSY